MTLTRQHFQLIANVVSQVADQSQRHILAMNFVSELQKTNPGFKIDVFLKACNAAQPAARHDDDPSREKESFIAP